MQSKPDPFANMGADPFGANIKPADPFANNSAVLAKNRETFFTARDSEFDFGF